MLVTKVVDLGLLDQELTAAGVSHRGLTLTAQQLMTSDEKGTFVELPDAALPVIAAHDPSKAPAAIARVNAQQLYTNLAGAYANWATLDAAGKDAAVQRAVGAAVSFLKQQFGF